MNFDNFRIEEGNVSIPVYELNRLQDFIKEQKQREEDFKELVKNEARILVMCRPLNDHDYRKTEMKMTFKDGQEDYEKALKDLDNKDHKIRKLQESNAACLSTIEKLEREIALLGIKWFHLWAFPKEVRAGIKKLKTKLHKELIKSAKEIKEMKR